MKLASLFHGVFFLAFLVVMPLFAQTAGTVTKEVRGNPTLAIVKFNGDPSARSVLEGMLYKCDWFRLLKDSSASKAQIQLSVTSSANGYAANVKTSDKSFALEASGLDLHEAAAKLTDGILRTLFKVPVMCSRPIAYVIAANGKKEIYTCRLDASGQEALTHNNALSSEPAWGHAGALVYTLNKNNALQIVLVDVANKRQRSVSKSKGLNSSAALSPNGQFLALPLSLDKQVDLYVLDLLAKTKTRITRDRNVESSPTFSPDGKTICFVSDRTGRPQLYLAPMQGGNATRLTKGASECVSPEWSQVSKKICFSTKKNGQYVIAVIDPAKPEEEPQIVTDGAGQWEAPSWAPDGRHVVCTRATGGAQDLYLVDTWYHTAIPLTKGAKVSLPAWAPAR